MKVFVIDIPEKKQLVHHKARVLCEISTLSEPSPAETRFFPARIENDERIPMV